MKKIIFCYSLLLICLGACKKDASNPLEKNLIGKWNFVSSSSVVDDNDPNNDENVVLDQSLHPYVEFKSEKIDKNLQISFGDNTQVLNYHWSGNSESNFYTDYFGESSVQSIKLSLDGKQLILHSEKIFSGVKVIIEIVLTRPLNVN